MNSATGTAPTSPHPDRSKGLGVNAVAELLCHTLATGVVWNPAATSAGRSRRARRHGNQAGPACRLNRLVVRRTKKRKELTAMIDEPWSASDRMSDEDQTATRAGKTPPRPPEVSDWATPTEGGPTSLPSSGFLPAGFARGSRPSWSVDEPRPLVLRGARVARARCFRRPIQQYGLRPVPHPAPAACPSPLARPWPKAQGPTHPPSARG